MGKAVSLLFFLAFFSCFFFLLFSFCFFSFCFFGSPLWLKRTLTLKGINTVHIIFRQISEPKAKAAPFQAPIWASLLGACLALSACGQRGPLYLPAPASPPAIQNQSLLLSPMGSPSTSPGPSSTHTSTPSSTPSSISSSNASSIPAP